MTMRAQIERDASRYSEARDPDGHALAPNWVITYDKLPMYFWIDARLERGQPGIVLDTRKDVVLSIGFAFVPLSSDVREGDRIKVITDRKDRELYRGPYRITLVSRRRSHKEVRVEVTEV